MSSTTRAPWEPSQGSPFSPVLAPTRPNPTPLQAWQIADEPYYQPHAQEVALYEHAWKHRMPLLLKGPTGCGKTRFVEHMAWRLGRPLITVACNEDTSAADLVGRWLLDAQGARWHDGPLTLAARHGAICYLDEVVEARQDTTVIIHPLTDARRTLPLDKRGELLHAHADFQLVVSYNPGYQSSAKDMKPSTRQRFIALEFDYPAPPVEAAIVAHEAGVPLPLATDLVALAQRTRQLCEQGLDEGVSTRLLIYAAQLISSGVDARTACHMTMTHALTDDPALSEALHALVEASFA